MIVKVAFKVKKKLGKLKRWLGNKPGQMKFVYAWHLKHASVKPDQVLFESFHGRDLSDSPLYIMKALEEMGMADRYEIYFATADKARHEEQAKALGLKVKLVDVHSFFYTRILATAAYLINNSSFPAWFIRRPEQVYLQTWHGTPLKTLGKKMRFGIESMYNVQHNFLQASHIMFPNEFTRDAMMGDYNLTALYTGKVVLCGYPRNSIFAHPDRAEAVREALGNGGFTTLAYMPTWRGQSNHDIRTEDYGQVMNAMLRQIDAALTDGQKLYVNFHPIVQESVKLDSYTHILPFPAGVDKYEFLNSVDALITDYSSVFFDFSITKKPVILFMYDYEAYMAERGMYLDIKSLPFRKIYTLEDLIDCLRTESFRADDYASDRAYTDRFIRYDGPDTGGRLARLIFCGDEGDLPVEDFGANAQKRWRVRWPSEMNTPSKLDALSQAVDPSQELIVFEKKFFTPELSAYLCDHYADAYNFLFLTASNPRTLAEEVLSRVLPSVRRRVHLRNIDRCFPGLNIDPAFIRENYSEQQAEAPKARLVRIGCRGARLSMTIALPAEGLRVKELLLYRRQAKGTGGALPQQGAFRDGAQRVPEGHEMNQRSRIGQGAEDALLDCLRSDQRPVSFSLPFTSLRRGNETILTCHADLGDYALEPVYWDLAVAAERSGPVSAPAGPGENTFASASAVTEDSAFTAHQERSGPVSSAVTEDGAFTAHQERSGPVSSAVTAKGAFTALQNISEARGGESGELNRGGPKELWLPVVTSAWQRARFALGSCACRLTGGWIFFPYRKELAFIFRKETAYDGAGQRLKEYAAAVLYLLGRPVWKRKRIWLIYEKFCATAQDNGWYFFKYCMEKLPEDEKKHIFYVLDSASPEWERTAPYRKQVLPFLSLRHMVYAMAARVYAASEASSHVYLWQARPNLVTSLTRKKPLVFLQHGVTAFKQVHPFFGRDTLGRESSFVTTSAFEQAIVTKYFGYTAENAPILGFCRWDVMENLASREDRFVLIMPTWRVWLEDERAEAFMESEYYRRYAALLASERLRRCQDAYGFRLVFYIHPRLSEQLRQFKADPRYVELIPFGSRPLNEVLMRCHMLITDYSSVSWDVFYLGKPVLFYQFDLAAYTRAHGGGYISFETDLFGDRFTEEEALLAGIEEYAAAGFGEKEVYGKMRPGLFAFRDQLSSARTYEYMIKKGY